ALHEMYVTLRTLVPGFNWSEQRFASIYPMHPLIAEVASAVRLYVPTFAFLPFASAAGAHAVSRPALSLVVLDEVFDRTERALRRAHMRAVFAEAAPAGSLLKNEEAGETRYSFKIDVPEIFSAAAAALTEQAAEAIAEDVEAEKSTSYTVTLSDEELARVPSWLTGRALPASLADADARDSVRGALAEWLQAWHAESPFDDF